MGSGQEEEVLHVRMPLSYIFCLSHDIFCLFFHPALHLHVNLLSSHRTSFAYFLVCHPASPCVSPCIIWSFMDHPWHSVTPPLSVAVLCLKSTAEQWPHSVTPPLWLFYEKSPPQWQLQIIDVSPHGACGSSMV